MLYKKLGDNLLYVVLFGSFARKDYGEYSDIDLLVITKNKYKLRKSDLGERIFDLEFKLCRHISIVGTYLDRFLELYNFNGCFKNAFMEGLFFYGNKNELETCIRTYEPIETVFENCDFSKV